MVSDAEEPQAEREGPVVPKGPSQAERMRTVRGERVKTVGGLDYSRGREVQRGEEMGRLRWW